MMTLNDRYAEAVMNTFGPPKLVLTRGEGAHVWDENGTEYVDLLGGIAVNSLGHAHPALVAAVRSVTAAASASASPYGTNVTSPGSGSKGSR